MPGMISGHGFSVEAARSHVAIHACRGPRHPWTIGGVTVDLPVIVDWVDVDSDAGAEAVRVNSRVDLIGGSPEIVEMAFIAPAGLDLAALQRDFRWAYPPRARL